MRISEIRQLSDEEISHRVVDLKDELFRLRFQLISGQLQNYRRIRQVKREIARVKTIIQERKLAANK